MINKLINYSDLAGQAIRGINQSELERAYHTIWNYLWECHPILVFGNGGSAAIADHFCCDFMKGITHSVNPGNLRPNVQSLCSNQSLLTAIANDLGYDQVFSEQIKYSFDNDVLAIAISASGNSSNIVEGLMCARRRGWSTIALVGFNGGKVLEHKLADHIIHVNSDNYGIVEDCHSMIMHSFAQGLSRND